MELNFTKIRNNIEKVKLSCDYTYEFLTNEFVQENWTTHGHNFRSYLATPNSSALQNILNYLSSDEIKRKAIDTLYENNPLMQSNWDGWSREQMFDKTLWGGQFLKDQPGYNIDLHVDSRIQIITMLMYFVEEDDVDQATTFYTDKNRSEPYRATTNFCEGTCFVNDYDVWHEGYNKSNKDRYLINLGLIVNV